jgi:hypothetical protein
MADVVHADGRRPPLRIYKRSTSDPAPQEVFMPDSLWYKLTKFIGWKRARGENVEPAAPLFISRCGRRVATRTLRYLFHLWQDRARFDRRFNFHALRHYADLRVMPSWVSVRASSMGAQAATAFLDAA